jgi:diadenosine tetraphosphate (Ap4A) HIT family hydrolase
MRQFFTENAGSFSLPVPPRCRFCRLDPAQAILSNEHAIALADGFPVTPGHTLIVTKRHIGSFFEASREEQAALFDLLGAMRQLLLCTPPLFGGDETLSVPDAFNIGINDGASAGQTVMHLHIHLIPRYAGDTEDPRGGVRWIMPVKAPYWKKLNGEAGLWGSREQPALCSSEDCSAHQAPAVNQPTI